MLLLVQIFEIFNNSIAKEGFYHYFGDRDFILKYKKIKIFYLKIQKRFHKKEKFIFTTTKLTIM